MNAAVQILILLFPIKTIFSNISIFFCVCTGASRGGGNGSTVVRTAWEVTSSGLIFTASSSHAVRLIMKLHLVLPFHIKVSFLGQHSGHP